VVADTLQKDLGLGARVRAARDHNRPAALVATHADGLGLAFGLLLEGTEPDAARINHAQHRHVHHAQHRAVAINERDIDGEFAVAVDEFLGAVERIDQPETRPGRARTVIQLRGFLGQYRNVGRELVQARDDHIVRGAVGLGQGRAVVLLGDLETALVDIENPAPGGDGDGARFIEVTTGIFRHEFTLRIRPAVPPRGSATRLRR
jgi:hypothetical protein